ncbi:hypothetical protein BC936DRAFT_143081 [Jimgerdemannia flammicorona]|uniref:Uncharacterized protein n=1 Tax=Jimgerdemannia flammicorona TaxID=994334 RepID=A0A432ZZE3_9FUNG|nr:hypothetical protein BC936DRAFT_143081 [Jimgerdemannia flammicorona]
MGIWEGRRESTIHPVITRSSSNTFKASKLLLRPMASPRRPSSSLAQNRKYLGRMTEQPLMAAYYVTEPDVAGL